MVNKFDELLDQFGSNTESLNETVLVDKKYLEEQKRKAKAFDGIYKFLSNSPIEPFFKEYLERIANELEDNND